MQLFAVLAAAALVNAIDAIQPVAQELEKKSTHRHGRWWRWRHRDHGHGHSHGHGNGGHGHHTDDGEAITEVFTYDDLMFSSIAISTIVDAATLTSTGYTYTTETPVISASIISSSLTLSSASSSIMASYNYPNATSTYIANSSTTISTSTPACSISASTSTLTVTESVTTTFTYTQSSASNSTWITSMSSTSQSSAPLPNITYTFNASQILNFTTFKASPYYPSTVLYTMVVSTTAADGSSSSALPSSSSFEASSTIPEPVPTSVFISADPIYVAPTTAVLHPSTTVSQTMTVVEGEATGVPDPTAFHCGVHGLPVGLYKMAEYWEERAGVDVTLEGCYEFCEAANEGCFSYSFYHEEGTNDARCDLFGGSVADSLDSIIKEVPRVWFDVGCGNPLLLK